MSVESFAVRSTCPARNPMDTSALRLPTCADPSSRATCQPVAAPGAAWKRQSDAAASTTAAAAAIARQGLRAGAAAGPAMPQRRQQLLQPLDLRIGRSRTVPQVVFSHSNSRNIFIPRQRFTRTDSGVSPVRAAISGPVIPSTRRRISVSR